MNSERHTSTLYASPPGVAPTIQVRRPRAGEGHVILTGEHDLTTRGQLETAVESVIATSSVLVVDVTDVDFLDSTLINALCQSRRRADDAGAEFSLVTGQNVLVRRVLEMASVLELLNVVEALERCGASDEALV